MKGAPTRVVDRQRAKQLNRKQQKEKPKLKNNPMINVFQIERPSKSTSKVAQSYYKRNWNEPTIRELVDQ